MGQTIKVKAVDTDGKPTAREAVAMQPAGYPKFEIIYEHSVTAEEITTVSRYSATDKTIPKLGEYNIFCAEIVFTENTKLSKWVALYLNGVSIGSFDGAVATKRRFTCTCNRLFGHWIGSSIYNSDTECARVSAVFAPMSVMQELSNADDATSIGIGSYGSDFGLVEGTILRIYAAK